MGPVRSHWVAFGPIGGLRGTGLYSTPKLGSIGTHPCLSPETAHANKKLYRRTPDLGSGGVREVIFAVNYFKEQNVAQKLRRIILLHFELVTFDFHFPKTQEVFIFMVYGPSGSMAPKTKYVRLWTQTVSKQTSIPKHFENILFLKYQNPAKRNVREDTCRSDTNKLEHLSYAILKVLNLGSTSSGKHELEILKFAN